MSAGPFNLSPSRIARHFHFDCDRFLRFAATPSARRAREDIPKPQTDGNPVARAILEGGYLWEDRLLDEHLLGSALIAEGDGPRRDRAYGVEESIACFKTAEPGRVIYQPTLRVGPSFIDRYGLDSDLLHFPDCRPDLIEIIAGGGGRRRLRIHDAKASSHQKLSHRIQVTLYALVLEATLEEAGIEDVAVDEIGGVWLANQDAPEEFDIGRTRPGVERFLGERVRPLFESPAGDASWHLNIRCEWCDWFPHCSKEAEQTRSVSLLPHLSTHARRYLRSLPDPISTIDELGHLLARDDADQVLSGVASLAGRRLRLRKQVNALVRKQAFAVGGASIALPRFEHIRIMLTLQTDPVSGEIYVFGWHRTGGNDLFGDDPRTVVEVAASDQPAVLLNVHRQLVLSLHRRLRQVHDFNHGKPFDQQLSLQCYVFDSYESSLLLSLLQGLLNDPEVGPLALDLFFHFQSPELLQARSHPDDAVVFPLVVLNQVVRELVALPVPVNYRFADVNNALLPKEYASEYKAKGLFTFQLSNQLKSDAIFHAWRKGKTDLIQAVEDEIGRRLRGADSILRGFRERIERHPESRLVSWAPKFQLPDAIDIEDPVLSRLAFIVRYESVGACLESRRRRALPLAERLSSGAVIPLVRRDDGRFDVETPVDADWDDGFPRYLLSPMTDEGEDSQMSYDDFGNRRSMRPPRGALALAAVVDRADDGSWYRLELRPGRGFGETRPDMRFLLHERFTDWNSDRVLGELGQLDSEPATSSVVRLITDPARYRRPAPDAAALRDTALEVADTSGFTSSQRRALEGVIGHTLQLVWGPPGTGKTWFLAQTVLTLLEAHRRAGRPCRIVVSAFTHAAIDNLLRRIRNLARESVSYREELVMGKAVRQEDPGPGIEPIAKQDTRAWLMAHERAVLGATVWRLQDGFPTDDGSGLDVVVIDEASQVRVAEAALAVRRVRPDGRLILAGDHRQLPPIINGIYPEPDPGQPLLHRSVFEAVRASDPDGACSAVLLENFRMCADLCRVPADQLYVPEYRPASEAIARQRLDINPTAIDDPFVARALDPENPLVVVIVDGVQTTGESPFEADHAARCALALRASCELPETSQGDRDFWRERLFIVTPHHVQKRCVIRHLQSRRTWRHPPFVDTVDKMQGQEAECVLVSYGVSDVELALRESEFIYSLNRLNVAITRARMKCVVFLPRPLLEPDLEAFADDQVAEGIAFMQALPGLATDVIEISPPNPVATHGPGRSAAEEL